MKLRCYLIVFALSVNCFFSDQIKAQYAFQRDYNFIGPTVIQIAEAADSGFCIATRKILDSSFYSLTLFKTSAKGVVTWSKKFGNEISYILSPSSIINDEDGGYLISGQARDSLENSWWGNSDIFCIKLDKNGNIIWGKKLGSDTLDEAATATALTSDGGIVVSASCDFTGVEYSSIFKLDPAGNLDWSSNLPSTEMRPYRIVVTKEGNIVCAGNFIDASSYNYISGFVVKLDALGNLIWCKTYSFDQSVQIWNITIAPCGYFISGDYSEDGILPYSPLLIKISEEGNVGWAKVYSSNWGTNNNLAMSSTVDGGVVMMLETQHYLGGKNNGLLKVDSAGIFQWAHQYMHQYGINTESVLQTRDNGYITAGYLDTTNYHTKLRLMKSDDMGKTPCNDSAVYVDTYVKSCTTLEHNCTITNGINIETLALSEFSFVLTDSLICIDTFSTTIQHMPTCDVSSINDSKMEVSIFINPNPAADYFNLICKVEKEITFALIDLFGREIRKFILNPSIKTHIVDVRDLPRGIYILQVKGSQTYTKLVLQ